VGLHEVSSANRKLKSLKSLECIGDQLNARTEYKCMSLIVPSRLLGFISHWVSLHLLNLHQMADATEETLSILKNSEIIAINQDPVIGSSITPFRWGINVRPIIPFYLFYQRLRTHQALDEIKLTLRSRRTGHLIRRIPRNIGAAKARMAR
jgi:hypothetical protein